MIEIPSGIAGRTIRIEWIEGQHNDQPQPKREAEDKEQPAPCFGQIDQEFYGIGWQHLLHMLNHYLANVSNSVPADGDKCKVKSFIMSIKVNIRLDYQSINVQSNVIHVRMCLYAGLNIFPVVSVY